MVKGLQAECIMGNMSAQILREIVSSTLGVKATDIRLSGAMPLNAIYEGWSSSGNMYSDDKDVQAWSFSTKNGLKSIPAILTERMSMQNANGSWSDSYGYTAEYLAEVAPEAIFFIIREEISYSDCNGRNEYSLNHTLYKAPNFREHWEKVEQEDIERWSSWLSK